MNKERLQQDLEKRLYAARDGIVAHLSELASSRTDRATIHVAVVYSEDSALTLDDKGRWHVRWDENTAHLGNSPSVETLVVQYASVSDPEYKKLELEGVTIRDKKSPERERLELEWEEKLHAYITAHKDELLQKFVEAIEQTLNNTVDNGTKIP